NGLAELQANLCSVAQKKPGSRRSSGSGRRRRSWYVVGRAFPRDRCRSLQRRLWPRRIFQQYDAILRNVANLALCGPNSKVLVVAAGDLHLFAALQGHADVQGSHRAIQKNEAARAWAVDPADALRATRRSRD